MDHNARNSGIGSKDPPRTMPSDPSKGGRLAATALGRPGNDDHGVKRSHDHVKHSASKEPQRIRKDFVERPKVDRNENDRERDILNQSMKRTKGGEGPNRVVRDEPAREREILSQSLKRTKVAAGGEDQKRVRDRDQQVQRAKGERDPVNQSLKRTQAPDDSKVRLENPREPVNPKSATRPDDLKVRLEDSRNSKSIAARPDDLKAKFKGATRPDGTRASVPDKAVTKETSRLPEAGKPGGIVKKENFSSDRKPDDPKVRLENPVKSKSATRPDGARAFVSAKAVKPGDVVKKESLTSDTRKRTMGVVKAEDVQRSGTKIDPVVATKNGRDVSKEPLRVVKMVTGTVMKAKQEKVKKKVFSLPGQRFEAPEERDAMRLFYGSLHRQIPTSDMANIWLMEHGLLEADEAQKVLTQKVKSKTGVVSKTPTPSKISNGSAGKSSKFRSEDLLDIKPVSKKLKL